MSDTTTRMFATSDLITVLNNSKTFLEALALLGFPLETIMLLFAKSNMQLEDLGANIETKVAIDLLKKRTEEKQKLEREQRQQSHQTFK